MKNLSQPKNTQKLEMALVGYSRIFIDLDHTIYDRFDYDFFAFLDMARHVLGESDKKAKEMALWIWDVKDKKGPHYRCLFNDFIEFYGLNSGVLPDLISFYQRYDPKNLVQEQSLRPLLKKIHNAGRHEIIVVTNGEKERQSLKIEALNLKEIVDEIIILDPRNKACKLKPDPHVIKEYQRLRGEVRAVIVGDDLTTDGQLARNTGLDFIHYEYTGTQRRSFLPYNGDE